MIANIACIFIFIFSVQAFSKGEHPDYKIDPSLMDQATDMNSRGIFIKFFVVSPLIPIPENTYFEKKVVCKNIKFDYEVSEKIMGLTKQGFLLAVPVDFGMNEVHCFIRTYFKTKDKYSFKDEMRGLEKMTMYYRPAPDENGNTFYTHLNWEIQLIAPFPGEKITVPSESIIVTGKAIPLEVGKHYLPNQLPTFLRAELYCRAVGERGWTTENDLSIRRNEKKEMLWRLDIPAKSGKIGVQCNYSFDLNKFSTFKFTYSPNEKVSGRVTFKNAPVSGAKVVLVDTVSNISFETMSDKMGGFVFFDIDNLHSFNLSSFYNDMHTAVTLKGFNSSQKIEVKLKHDLNWFFKSLIINRKKTAAHSFNYAKDQGVISAEDDFYKRLLLVCAELDCDSEIKMGILSKLKNANYTLEDGKNPLYFAVFYDDQAFCEELLKKGAISNLPDSDYSPLAFAFNVKNYVLFQLLIERSKVPLDQLQNFARTWISQDQLTQIPKNISKFFPPNLIGRFRDDKTTNSDDRIKNKHINFRAAEFILLNKHDDKTLLNGTAKLQEYEHQVLFYGTKPGWDGDLTVKFEDVSNDKLRSLFEIRILDEEYPDPELLNVYDMKNNWLKLKLVGKKEDPFVWVHLSQFKFFNGDF